MRLLALVLSAGVLASCGNTGAPPRVTESITPAATTTSASPTTPAPLPLAGRTVVIDPGHQLGNSRHTKQINKRVSVGNGRKACNSTGAATNRGYPEATFAFKVAQHMQQRLEKLGAKVILTRTANSKALWGPCVDKRGRAGNKVKADVKISIHGDGSAAGNHGFHVIAPKALMELTASIAKPSHAFAVDLRRALVRADFSTSTYTGGADAINIRSDLGTLNLSKIPVAMVELGNMRNARDAAVMSSSKGQKRYAKALVAGVRFFLSSRP
ncbi:MAG: hypothetical protein JWP10_1430 [Nocardioidaceae bacterium]|nr:hypothetical protein [Nocardioidaceae bacterium]